MSDAKPAPAEDPKAKGGKKGKKAAKDGKGKKGKMPMFIVLGVVLLGGGFFGMKASKGKEVKKAPPIEIGDHTAIVNLGSFLVNTRDGQMYLKANVLVHLAKGKALFEAGGHGAKIGVETTAPYVDAIREVFAKLTAEDLVSPEGEREVKMKIAEAVNVVFERLEPKVDEKGKKIEKPAPPTGGGDPLWDSQKGPALVVYLTEYVWENTG